MFPCQLDKPQSRGGCPTVRKVQEEVESFCLAELEFWMSLGCECAILGTLFLVLQAKQLSEFIIPMGEDQGVSICKRALKWS